MSLFWGPKKIKLLRQELFYKGLFVVREKTLIDVQGQFKTAALKTLCVVWSETTPSLNLC